MKEPSADLFLESCGADGPLELEVTGPGSAAPRLHAFAPPFAIVGRQAAGTLRLDAAEVSRRHAYVQAVAGRVLCVDLGSRTGTFWGRERRPWGWLSLEEAVRIGPFSLRLARDVSGQQGAPTATDSPGPLTAGSLHPAARPDWSIGLRQEGQGGPRWQVDRVLTLVGRSSRCKLRLPHHSVSNFHCALLATPAGVWVVDLLSREGTCVNGERVNWALLKAGDDLRLGKELIRLRDGRPALPAGGNSRGLARALPVPAEGAAKAGTALAPVGSAATASGPVLPAALPDLQALFLRLSSLSPAQPSGGQPVGPAFDHQTALAPVLAQLGLMQQQLYEHFQQTMMIMTQMFTALHKDQNEAIRAELERVQQLTSELQSLRAELAKARPTPQPVAPAAGPTPEGPPEGPPRQPLPGPTEPAANGRPGSRPPPPKPDHRTPPAPTVAAPAGAKEGGRLPAPPPQAGPLEENIHVLLAQRVAALEQERRGRWQKILDFMQGKA